MHQRSLEALTVVPVEAFSPKPMNDVQKRLQAILDYWGPNGERHHRGMCGPNQSGCFVHVSMTYCGNGTYERQAPLNEVASRAAMEMGFTDAAPCSDSSFANARKMVLRAIELAA